MQVTQKNKIHLLIGDPTKAIEKLRWKIKYDLKMLVNDMVTSDIIIFQKEKVLKEMGYEIKNQFE
nr:GDP-D-mannose dehydratase [Mucilaginibacter sp. FT3.2]